MYYPEESRLEDQVEKYLIARAAALPNFLACSMLVLWVMLSSVGPPPVVILASI